MLAVKFLPLLPQFQRPFRLMQGLFGQLCGTFQDLCTFGVSSIGRARLGEQQVKQCLVLATAP